MNHIDRYRLNAIGGMDAMLRKFKDAQPHTYESFGKEIHQTVEDGFKDSLLTEHPIGLSFHDRHQFPASQQRQEMLNVMSGWDTEAAR